MPNLLHYESVSWRELSTIKGAVNADHNGPFNTTIERK